MDKLLKFVSDETESLISRFCNMLEENNIEPRSLVKQDPLGNIMFVYFGFRNFKRGYYIAVTFAKDHKEIIYTDFLDSYGVATALKELEEHGC